MCHCCTMFDHTTYRVLHAIHHLALEILDRLLKSFVLHVFPSWVRECLPLYEFCLPVRTISVLADSTPLFIIASKGCFRNSLAFWVRGLQTALFFVGKRILDIIAKSRFSK